MKVGIMGTHGVGKTGFALRMAADMKRGHPGEQVGLVTETARKCPFPVNQDTSVEAQLWIYHTQFAAEIEATALNEILICDRTVLDAVVYTEVAGFRGLRAEMLPGAISWMGTYDELYWIRPGMDPIGADRFRDTDPEYQKKVDAVFSRWIKQHKIPVAQCIFGEKGNR